MERRDLHALYEAIDRAEAIYEIRCSPDYWYSLLFMHYKEWMEPRSGDAGVVFDFDWCNPHTTQAEDVVAYMHALRDLKNELVTLE